VTPSQSTNYYVSIYNAGTPNVDSVNISISAPSVNLGNDTSICGSGSIVFDAGSGFAGYLWNSGETSQTINKNTSDLYTVVVTDAFSCEAYDSINLSIVGAPVPTASIGDTLICYAASTTLGVSVSGGAPPYTYQWNNVNKLNNSTISNPTASILLTSMSFVVSVTDSNGCVGIDTSDIISVRDQFSAGSIDNTGESIPNGGDPSTIIELVPASGGSPPYEYFWAKDGNAIANTDNINYDPPSGSGSATYERLAQDKGLPNCNGWAASSNKYIVTELPPQYNISGTVYDSSNNVVITGEINLFKLSIGNGEANQVAFTNIDSQGTYAFFNVDSGRYLLQANIMLNITNALPTYSPSSFYWYDAQILNLQSNQTNVDIHILQLLTDTAGLGYISGFLKEGSLLRGPSDPIDSIVIGLNRQDPTNGGVLMLDTTDSTGFFEFNDVPSGTYNVIPDVTGIPVDTTGLNHIVMSGADTTEVSFLVDSSLIHTSTITKIKRLDITKLKLWPNPVHDKLNVRTEQRYDIVNIYDSKAQLVSFSMLSSGKDLYINTSKLMPGMYLIELRNNKTQALGRFLKY
ncbi:MAG TPA: T9SS type A sorting domain-containing protein, partial [Bacteroidetes bacterium]|nr:T9SS type A sorting domain-containing protein [Bacteroidota bacterium]